MRVALVSPGYPPTPGGVETVVAHSARALVRAGITVEVLTQERRRDLDSRSEDQGVLVRRFPSNQAENYRCAPGLYRYLARHHDDYDVVHGHSYHALTGVAAALCLSATRARTPYVLTPHYHGTGHTAARSLLHRAYRPLGHAALASAGSVLCVSRPEADLLRAHFPDLAEKISMVPNAVDATAIRAARRFDDEPPTVLSVGRLERYKHIDRLIEAFGAFTVPASARPAAQLVVIGSGPDRARLQEVAARCGVADRVRFLGRVGDDELRRWLRTAAALCSLSEHEAYGLAPAEALTAGARVVLSDIPAHAELAAAEHGARLVPPDAGPDRIAAALADALAADDQAPALTILDWDDVAKLLIDVYRGAVYRGARRAGAGVTA